jgi:hypothetical protein
MTAGPFEGTGTMGDHQFPNATRNWGFVSFLHRRDSIATAQQQHSSSRQHAIMIADSD